MKRAAFRSSAVAVATVMVLLALTGLALAKSLYVIADQNPIPTPIRAYNINATGTLTFQAEYGVSGVWGAVGLGLDSATNILFVTYESYNIINLVDAKTMQGIGSTVAPGATNLAGIVVDDTKNLVYTVDRGTSTLYVYNWDATNKTLTLDKQVTLANVGGSGAFGIALDKIKGLLYVGNASTSIPYYHTSDWSQAGTLTLAGPAIGVAVDPVRGFLYYGAAWSYYSRLDWYNLKTAATGGVDLGYGSGAMGIGVDEETGLVYITTGFQGDELRVYRYNKSLANLRLFQNVGVIGGAPTGLAIGAGFNPLNLDKTADLVKVSPGQNLTYTLSFDNTNNPNPVRNVILTDSLPTQTDFVSASGSGVYNPDTHKVTWNIGDLAAGAPPQTVQVVVQVKSDTPNTRIRNTATIDSDDTPPTTKSLQTLVVRKPILLACPIPGYTPYTAPVIAVLDHTCLETIPKRFYVKDDKVKAYNGEVGEKIYGENTLKGLWKGYKNSSGSDFLTGILNYLGGPYLYYDGHPGYDYQVPKGTDILATADGKLYTAKYDPVNGGGWKGYKTFYIKHAGVTTGGIRDYYTWYLYVNLTDAILDQVKQNGFADVQKGQVIGKSYNDWFHVDFRSPWIGHGSIIDPYKLGLWE